MTSASTINEWLDTQLTPVDMDSLEKDAECDICKVVFGQPDEDVPPELPVRTVQCNHIFGANCIRQAVVARLTASSNQCPMCRTEFFPSGLRYRNAATEGAGHNPQSDGDINDSFLSFIYEDRLDEFVERFAMELAAFEDHREVDGFSEDEFAEGEDLQEDDEHDEEGGFRLADLDAAIDAMTEEMGALN